MGEYEAVIGLECHVELSTATKMFCSCANVFGAPPNTQTCPVCLGHPGTLPVPNREAIARIIKIGLALDAEIAPHSLFHRKNYFYPDMPKNYQISQYDLPICVGGHLEIEPADGAARRIGITRVHMEEDTGKSTHGGGSGRIHDATHATLDFNRAGVPLVECVSEPDLRSPEEAAAYLRELRGTLESLDVSDVKMEEGSLRCDANVSLRLIGAEALGTKVEIKNMNSIRSLERALVFEIERQGAALDAGDAIVQETRHWDEDAGTTASMRSKEEAFDYRYFPEPDIRPRMGRGDPHDDPGAASGTPRPVRGPLRAEAGGRQGPRRRPRRHRLLRGSGRARCRRRRRGELGNSGRRRPPQRRWRRRQAHFPTRRRRRAVDRGGRRVERGCETGARGLVRLGGARRGGGRSPRPPPGLRHRRPRHARRCRARGAPGRRPEVPRRQGGCDRLPGRAVDAEGGAGPAGSRCGVWPSSAWSGRSRASSRSRCSGCGEAPTRSTPTGSTT
jgi:hypothetical protein